MTLIGQTIAMIVFVWFCMKFIWPPILGAIEERQKQIADGLAAADESEKKLTAAQAEADGIISDARKQATSILDQAHARANEIVAEGKADGVKERDRQLAAAQGGDPVPWPSETAEQLQPGPFKDALDAFVESQEGMDVVTVDCDEYPCMALVRLDDSDEELRELLKPHIDKVVDDMGGGGVSVSASNHSWDDHDMQLVADRHDGAPEFLSNACNLPVKIRRPAMIQALGGFIEQE